MFSSSVRLIIRHMDTSNLINALRKCTLILVVVVSCALTACGSSSSTDTVSSMDSVESTSGLNNNGLLTSSEDTSGQQVGVAVLSPSTESSTNDSAAVERANLINQITPRCIVVGEPFTLTVLERKTSSEGMEPELINVTRFASLIQTNSTALEIISRTDESVTLVMKKQDIASLTSEIENGSITAFLGAFDLDSPSSSVLRKPVPGGCYVALRLDNDRFCGTAFGKAATIDLKLIDEGISITGCDIDNASGLPIIEIAPE